MAEAKCQVAWLGTLWAWFGKLVRVTKPGKSLSLE